MPPTAPKIEPAPFEPAALDAVPRVEGVWRRFSAYCGTLFVDHGIFRALYPHFHWIAPTMARSNNPLPHHVRWAKQRGIRTIVNLRGENPSTWYYLEAEACRRHGLALVNFRAKSRDVPSKEMVLGAKAMFEAIEYPALMHCKSGADRVGLMATLYLILHEGWHVADAMRQLSPWYGHVKQSKTGLIDHFFETYLAETAERPKPFLDWVVEDYDPAATKASFRASGWANALVDRILKRE